MADDEDIYTVAGFLSFHAINPWVWRLFEDYGLLRIRQGQQNYGAKSIFEDIRWHTDMQRTDPEYKLNNNWAPFYARAFNLKHKFAYFRLRRSRADDMVEKDIEGF